MWYLTQVKILGRIPPIPHGIPPILGGIPPGIMEPPGWDSVNPMWDPRWDSVNPMWDPGFVPGRILAWIPPSWVESQLQSHQGYLENLLFRIPGRISPISLWILPITTVKVLVILHWVTCLVRSWQSHLISQMVSKMLPGIKAFTQLPAFLWLWSTMKLIITGTCSNMWLLLNYTQFKRNAHDLFANIQLNNVLKLSIIDNYITMQMYM